MVAKLRKLDFLIALIENQQADLDEDLTSLSFCTINGKLPWYQAHNSHSLIIQHVRLNSLLSIKLIRAFGMKVINNNKKEQLLLQR